jgi:IS605 OrfB family transposase
MVRKKRYIRRNDFLSQFKHIVKQHSNELPKSNTKTTYSVETDSWFELKKYNYLNSTKPIIKNVDELKQVTHKSKKVKMILTESHKQILQQWFKASTYIYNETLKYLFEKFPFTKSNIIRSILSDEMENNDKFLKKLYIRNQMKDIKTEIKNNFTVIIDKAHTLNNKNMKCKIDIHTLDKTIFQLIENINTSKLNLLKNNIKRFRLKRWKYTRPSQTIGLEKVKFTGGILCKSLFKNLPDIKYIYNKKEIIIDDITCDFKINYNSILNEYHLIIPENVNITQNTHTKKVISLDPGLRTFMTGLSENEYIEIAPRINNIIQADLEKLNIIKNNDFIPSKIKKKHERNCFRKIKNKIDDMQWKAIKFLTSTYKTIFLGDMSAKDIISKKNTTLSKKAKDACNKSKYYIFQERLKYKCYTTGTQFKLIDEYYTSKTCSLCCNYKEDLQGNKEYNCLKCKSSIDRDLNSCRNIYMRQYYI